MKKELFTISKHQTTNLLKELKDKKEPVLLLEELVCGEKAVLEDRSVLHSEAKKRMVRWLGIGE